VPKPGVIPLRPLGVGEVLDGAITYIRSNPVVTLGLSAVVITITQLIQVPITILALGQLSTIASPTAGIEQLAGALSSTLGAALIGGFITFIAITVLSGLLVVVLSQAVLGRRMSLGEAWAATRSRVLGLIGLSLLSSVVLVAVLLTGVVPIVLTAAADAPGGVVVLVGLVTMLGAFAAAAYIGVSWSMITPAYVLEGIPAMATFRRSHRLVRTQWWRIFGILLLGGVLTAVVSGILTFPFSLLGVGLSGSAPGADPFAGPSVLTTTIGAVGTIVASTVTAPFSAGITGLLYFDQRIRREAFDLELARAAQFPAVPPAPPQW